MTDTEEQLVRRHLQSLSHDDLVERLVSLARRDDALSLSLVVEAQATGGTLDMRALRKDLTAMLRVRNRTYDRRYTREYAREVGDALDVLEGILDAGQATAVVDLAEYCMKRLDTALGNVDDSGGHLIDPVERLKEIHHAACVAARGDPRQLAISLADKALAADSDWEWFLDAPTRYADVLGDEGIDAFRDRLEPAWAALPSLPASHESSGARWDSGRFRLTYLREGVARAGGSVDELVSVLARDLSSAHQFLRIADELEAAGREREALSWLERGNAVHAPAGDPQLTSRIVAAYLRDGQIDDAIDLAGRAHTHAPSVTAYHRLREAAEALGDWDDRRPAALERLREADRFGGRSSAVRAQLDEGDLDGAWNDAQTGGCQTSTWLELADASRERRPDDAVEVYRRHVDTALERADDTAYKHAVDLLQRWRATLELHGRQAELAADVARIREDNRRRTRFLKRMDAAGLA